MKIGFIGNTNNYPFTLALALKRQGHEIIFIVDKQSILDRPESRYPGQLAGYGKWIFDYSDVGKNLSLRDFMLPLEELDKVTELIDFLSDCGAYVVNGLWPILIKQLNKPYFIQSTGSDIELYADAQSLFSTLQLPFKVYKPELEPYYWDFATEFTKLQKNAFISANGVNSFPQNMVPNIDRILASLPLTGDLCRFLFTDCDELKAVSLPENDTLQLFNTARLNWRYPVPPGYSELDYKGTDILLKAFARYIQEQQFPMQLTLARKGLHIQETKALVEELSLQDHVCWLDEMPQHNFFEQVKKSDIICDNLSERNTIGMALMDSMALGRPTISTTKECISACGKDTTSTITDVFQRLVDLTDKDQRKKAARDSREYVEKYHSVNLVAEKIINIFHSSGSKGNRA